MEMAIQDILFLVLVCVLILIIFGFGYSRGQDSAVDYYNKFLSHLGDIAIKENWSAKEIVEKIDDFKSGRNPSNLCVAKKCCPIDSSDCIDCGYNAESKRKIKEIKPNE